MRAPFSLARRALSTAAAGAAAPPPVLSNTPRIAALAPARVPVEEGKAYFWCACGHTKTEPWCDGSHKALSTIRPVKWTAPKTGTASICACRHTRREGRVLCDGGHVHLLAAEDKGAAAAAGPNELLKKQ
jgi:CDGSH-type Zn-finger protein